VSERQARRRGAVTSLADAERLDISFISAAEVATILRADVRTVRKAIGTGDIPSVRVGDVVRVPVAWLRERARERETEA
jgi:excisionase family DNA binding protein